MPEETTLQSMLGLNRNEIEILMRLVAWGSLAREQIPANATCGHRPVKLSSVNAIVGQLRKKLRTRGIEVGTLHGFGFELRQEDREKIVALIGPRGTWRVNTAAARAKSRQEGRMEPGEQKTRPAAVWRSRGYQDQAEDDAERIDRIAAAKLEEATEGV